MATEYKWTVTSMSCYPQVDGYQNVVFFVEWVCTGINGAISIPYSSVTNIAFVPDSTFTPYADLTEAEVVNWVQTTLGPEQTASIEFGIGSSIDVLLTTPIVLPLPWGA